VRKHIMRLVAGTVVALAIPVAAASANGGDYIAGLGANNPKAPAPINYFAFAAHSWSGGANPYGFVGFLDTTSNPWRGFAGPVQCLKVDGNEATAVISLGLDFTGSPGLAGGGDEIFVKDNGKPVHGQPVDQIRNILFPASAWDKHQVCDDPTDPGTQIISLGDIVVHDGTP
jgi:hypothetical protein